ncbi:inverted formin-2-like [Pyrus ussuriensis x Pyrus communis]|uniref:Inverted formin-2-like n=1 Tax=Pyrus ussuriensis x Pyrus communis TaxID=2448454 RepID=A0A5N5GWU3_9ROSA|nr:inverted formin-2-like [Pyrus ussuriensis x Pyrus communis]
MADCTGGRQKEGYSVEATAAVRNRLSGLRLDSTFKSSSVVDPKNPTKTLKRRSPTQSPPVSVPNAKKEKLSLPPSPLLRRCISDTFFFNPTPPALQSPPEPTVTVTPPSPPPPAPTTNKVFASASDSAINSKPKLRRSVSDPTPRSPKTVSGSDEDDETPNSKPVVPTSHADEVEDQDEGDEEQHHQEQDENGGTSPADQHANHNTNSVSAAEDDCERKFEESVRVERLEECQVIRFRCGCGVPYDFLLAGDNCYYKLM